MQGNIYNASHCREKWTILVRKQEQSHLKIKKNRPVFYQFPSYVSLSASFALRAIALIIINSFYLKTLYSLRSKA